MKKGLLILTFCSLLSGLRGALAASLESGAAFLQIDPTARPAAMAGAYTAAAGDVDGLPYNPASLSTLQGKEAAFTHAEWLVDSAYDYLIYGQPTRLGSFALSALRLGYGDLERREANRLNTGSFEASDSAYTLGYANKIAGIGVGGSAKILQQKIDTEDAVSYAFDFGAVGRLPGLPLSLGASVLNVGPDVKLVDQSDPLPLTWAVGGMFTTRTLKVNADLKHQSHNETTELLAGIEFSPIALISLRAGYRFPFSSINDESTFDVDNLRGGIGLQISRFRLDYALAAFGDLGLTHRFTLSLRFSGPTDDRNVLAPEPAENK